MYPVRWLWRSLTEGTDTANEEGGGGTDDDYILCDACNGTGLRADLVAITLHGKSMSDFLRMDCRAVRAFLQPIQTEARNPAMLRVLKEIDASLGRVEEAGLGYLQLMRRMRQSQSG